MSANWERPGVMRTLHVLMWWEEKTATTVPAILDSLEMDSLVLVSLTYSHWMGIDMCGVASV